MKGANRAVGAGPTRGWLYALVAATAAWTTYLLWSSYFYVDDFLRLGQAARSKLDWSYLSDSVFGHFVPLWRLTFFFLERNSGLAYRPAIVFEVLLQTAMVVGVYRLLATLFGHRMVVIVATGAYALSPAFMPTDFWFANALHVLPSLTAMIYALDGFTRWYKNRRLHSLVVSVVSGFVGLMFYEKPVLIFLLMPMIVMVVSLAGRRLLPGLSRGLREVARLWPVWLLYAVPQGPYFWYYFSHHYYLKGTRPSISAFARVVWKAWADGIGVWLIGGPYSWSRAGVPGLRDADPSPLAVHLGLSLLAAVVVGSLLFKRRAWIGWIFAVIGFAASFGTVAWGRLGLVGPTIAIDYRYTADTLVLVLIGGMLALLPMESSWSALPTPTDEALRTVEPQETRESRSSRVALIVRSLAGCIAIAYLAGSLVSIERYRHTWTTAVPRAWTDNLQSSLADLRRSRSPFSLFDGPVIDTMALAQGYPTNLISWEIYQITPTLSFDDASKRMYTVDSGGSVVPGRLSLQRSASGSALSARPVVGNKLGSVCLPRGSVTLRASFAPVGTNFYTLAINYEDTAEATATVVPDGSERARIGPMVPVSVALPPEHSLAYAALNPSALEGIRLDIESPQGVCIQTVAVGLPVPAS